MKFYIPAAVLLVFCATGASAQFYARCADYQRITIEQILPGAGVLAIQSASRVGDTPEYRRWFGTFSPENAERVRGNLKRLHKALSGEQLRFHCGHQDEPACKEGAYAYVYQTETYAMTFCPSFFSLPSMVGGSPTDDAYEYGTMEGTVIHEMSHFDVIAGTDDTCYGRTACMDLAQRTPQDAIENADSYQYFAEDVGFAIVASAPVEGVVKN